MAQNYVNRYLVSFNTYVLQPIQHNSKIFTHVIDKHNELIVTRKPLHVLRKSCISLGTTYEAAKQSAKRFLAINISYRLLLPLITAIHVFFYQPIHQTPSIIYGLVFMPLLILPLVKLAVL